MPESPKPPKGGDGKVAVVEKPKEKEPKEKEDKEKE